MNRKIVLIGFVLIFFVLLYIYYSLLDIRVTVLAYHSVSEWYPKSEASLFVKPETFETQIRALKQNGYSFISFKDFEDWKLGKKEIPKKSIIITFDDGYQDNYLLAFPILKKYNVKATMFIITSYVGKSDRYLNWDQIKTMYDSGLIEIGSHTNTHKPLASLSVKDLDSELTISRDEIKKHIGITPYALAYPDGAWNNITVQHAKNAGFTIQANSDSTSLGAITPLDNCGRIIADDSFSGIAMLHRIEHSRIISLIKIPYFLIKNAAYLIISPFKNSVVKTKIV